MRLLRVLKTVCAKDTLYRHVNLQLTRHHYIKGRPFDLLEEILEMAFAQILKILVHTQTQRRTVQTDPHSFFLHI